MEDWNLIGYIQLGNKRKFLFSEREYQDAVIKGLKVKRFFRGKVYDRPGEEYIQIYKDKKTGEYLTEREALTKAMELSKQLAQKSTQPIDPLSATKPLQPYDLTQVVETSTKKTVTDKGFVEQAIPKTYWAEPDFIEKMREYKSKKQPYDIVQSTLTWFANDKPIRTYNILGVRKKGIAKTDSLLTPRIKKTAYGSYFKTLSLGIRQSSSVGYSLLSGADVSQKTPFSLI